MPPARDNHQRRRSALPRLLPVVLLLLALPLTAGCLTTLAVSAVAGSGAGGEHLDAAKETARDAANVARDKTIEIAEAAEVVLESLGPDEE